jgi:hypothetical protein
VQALAMATSAVLWQWDRLFLGGFELFFWVDDDSSYPFIKPWDIPGRVNSADATITVSVLSLVMLPVVVPWVIFHDRCVVVVQSLVVLGWLAMNVVIMVSPAFLQPAIAFFVIFPFVLFYLFLGPLLENPIIIEESIQSNDHQDDLRSRNHGQSWPHKIPYRLHCCRCARRAAEDWCGLCRMREAGGTCSTDSAQEAAAVVRYSAQPGELRHEPPPQWGSDAASVATVPTHWGRTRFSVTEAMLERRYNDLRESECGCWCLPFLWGFHMIYAVSWLCRDALGRLRFPVSFGRAWKRDDKARTIASLAFSEVTVSAGCKSGEVAYWEVEVLRMGECLRVGWRRRDGRGLGEWLDCSKSQHALLSMRHFSTSTFCTLSAGDRVCIQRSGRRTGVLEFVRATENRGAHVKLDGCGEQKFFQSELYQVVTENLWDVSVSEGDVIGLACDLHQGKLSWSLNGDWGRIVSIDLDKV